MNRRGFLKSFAVGIAAMSAATSMPGIAANILQPLPDPYSKFKIALDIFDNDILPYAGAKWNSPSSDVAAVGINTALVHIRETFSLPSKESTPECWRMSEKVIRGLKEGNEYAKFEDIRVALEGEPPEIMEQVWPIGFMILILRDYRVPMDHHKVVEFQWFHETYGHFVLGN